MSVIIRLCRFAPEELDRTGVQDLLAAVPLVSDETSFASALAAGTLFDLGNEWEVVHAALTGGSPDSRGAGYQPVLGGGMLGRTETEVLVSLAPTDVDDVAHYLSGRPPASSERQPHGHGGSTRWRDQRPVRPPCSERAPEPLYLLCEGCVGRRCCGEARLLLTGRWYLCSTPEQGMGSNDDENFLFATSRTSSARTRERSRAPQRSTISRRICSVVWCITRQGDPPIFDRREIRAHRVSGHVLRRSEHVDRHSGSNARLRPRKAFGRATEPHHQVAHGSGPEHLSRRTLPLYGTGPVGAREVCGELTAADVQDLGAWYNGAVVQRSNGGPSFYGIDPGSRRYGDNVVQWRGMIESTLG